jgi:hypothetical protein
MTKQTKPNNILTQEEWDEMVALKEAMSYRIAQVHPEKMEEFTSYLVRTLKERGG